MGETGLNFGAYRLLERLGKGGMGETWHAVRDDGQGVSKDVVIKRILRSVSDDPIFVEAFISEARLSARLSHGNVAQVFEFGEVQGEYFMALEFVHGQSLATALKRAKERGLRGVPAAFAVYVAMEMLKGLHHAHQRTGPDGKPLHIVHRDVSPDNVLLSYEGEVKVVDFGIAKAQFKGRAETEPGMVKGKYLFFAPEQARGENVDLRADLFSTGVVLYAMLAGQLPLEGQSHIVLHKLVRGELPKLHESAPWVPPILGHLVARAMAPHRDDRFASALEFQQALSAAQRDLAPDTSQLTVSGMMTWLFGQELSSLGRTVVVPATIRRLVDQHQNAAPIDRLVTAPGLPAHAVNTREERPADVRPARPALNRTIARASIVGATALLVLAAVRFLSPADAPPEQPPLSRAQAAIEHGRLDEARLIIADCKHDGPCPGGDALINAAERGAIRDALPSAPAPSAPEPATLDQVDQLLSTGEWGRARTELDELLANPETAGAAKNRLNLMRTEEVCLSQLGESDLLIDRGQLEEAELRIVRCKHTTLLDTRYRQVTARLEAARLERLKDVPPRPPPDPAIRGLLSDAKGAMQKQHWSTAMASYRKALALKPDSIDAREGLGVALVMSETGYREAIPLLQDAAKSDPANAQVWLSLGTALQHVGRDHEAREPYLEYLKLEPKGVTANEVRLTLKALK